jgi:hypothetical protein
MEQAAERVCYIFNGLNERDRRALQVRLLAIGALKSGEPFEFIADIGGETAEVIVNFLGVARA